MREQRVVKGSYLPKDKYKEEPMTPEILKRIFQGKKIEAIDLQTDDDNTCLYLMFDDLSCVGIEIDPTSDVAIVEERLIIGLRLCVREMDIWEEEEWDVPPVKRLRPFDDD